MIPRFNNPVDLLPEDSARDLLRPHFESILLSFNDAWGAWNRLGESDPDFRAALGPIARANCVSDHIRHRVRKHFHGREIENIHIREKSRLFLLDIKGMALLRFKKLSFDLLASNIRTHQQLQLQFQLSLPGLPEATHLTCGYVLDTLQTDIEQMVVTCRLGEELKYKISINEMGDDGTLPMLGDDPSTPPDGFIVRPLSRPEEKSGNQE